MRIISMLVLLILGSAFSAEAGTKKSLPDTAILQAMDVYAFIEENLLSPLPNESCRQEMRKVLLEVAHMSPAPKSRWSDEKLLNSLRRKRCVDWHFQVFSKQDSQDYIVDKCRLDPIQLSRRTGVWVLKIRDLDFGINHGDEPCKNRPKIFKAFVENIRWNESSIPFGALDILDLRNEPGGEQGAVLYLLGELFSPKEDGLSITRTERVGEAEKIFSYETKKRGLFGCPRIILANKATASASEILADSILRGCPQTKIVGQQTYGKAVGAYEREVGNYIIWGIVTTSYSYPGARLKDGVGITPDIVTRPGEEMPAALKYLKEHPRHTANQ